MSFKIAFSILVIAFSVSLSFADQLVFKNGDRVSGSVVKKDGDKITIKTDAFGVVTTTWDQVVSIKTDAPLTVELQSGKSAEGTLAVQDDKLTITSGGSTDTVSLADLKVARNADEQKAYLRMQHPPFSALWAGSGTVGFAGTAGNSRTQTFTTGFAANRLTTTDKTSLYINAVKASALTAGKNADTAQAIRGGIGYNHNVSSRVFLSAFNDYEYDKFQNLDLRYVLGGGLGFSAMKTDAARLDLVAGAAYNHEKFNTKLTRSSAEMYWGDDYSRKMNKASVFTQGFRMFNNLSESGEYRMNGDIGLASQLAKWLTWNVTLSDRYLSNPSVGRKKNDVLYTTGFGFTFAK